MDFKEEIILKQYMPDKNNTNIMCSFFYALSDNTRLRIIILLMLKPLCVGEVSKLLDINQTTVSHQLKILKSLNIVDFNRSGKNIIYYIKNSNIENVFSAMVECI